MVVECVSPVSHQTLQLVMDYITDAVVSTAVLSGKPFVSPDSRHVVTVDDLTGKISVAGVSNEGKQLCSSSLCMLPRNISVAGVSNEGKQLCSSSLCMLPRNISVAGISNEGKQLWRSSIFMFPRELSQILIVLVCQGSNALQSALRQPKNGSNVALYKLSFTAIFFAARQDNDLRQYFKK